MKLFALAAVAAALVATAATPADARRSKSTDTEAASSWDGSMRASSSYDQRPFWEQADDKPQRRSRQARAERVAQDDGERPQRRSRRATSEASSSEGRSSYSAPRESVGGVGPRPSKWCGWYMRTQRGGGPELNLAWNWSRWGSHASGPQIGAVVVWPNHVGEIVGQASDGRWIVRSGNDSGAVRERARSVSGAVFRVG